MRAGLELARACVQGERVFGIRAWRRVNATRSPMAKSFTPSPSFATVPEPTNAPAEGEVFVDRTVESGDSRVAHSREREANLVLERHG